MTTRLTIFLFAALLVGTAGAIDDSVWNTQRAAAPDLEPRAHSAGCRVCGAKVGATCESVDAAARKVITDVGFGPDYKVPGLPHRTGHGIGLGGHEWTYLVRGNKTPPGARYVFQRRAHADHLRGVRRALGGLLLYDRGRPTVL